MDAAQNSGTPAQMPEPAATEQKTDMAGTATERLKKAFFHQMRDVQPKQDTLDLFAQIVLVLDAHFTKYCSFYDPLLLLQKQEQLPSFYSSFFGQTRDLNKISVSALTKEAGINRTTFYKLFPNVQALYDACCEDLTQEFLSIPIPKEKTAADMLQNYGLVLWSTMKREQETMTLLSHRIPRRDLPYKIAMRLRAHLAASLRTEERVSFTVHENLAVFPDLFSTWLSQKQNNTVIVNEKGEQDAEMARKSQQNNMTMIIMGPLFSLYIGFIAPAGLSLYWFVQSVIRTVQDFFLTRHYKKVYDAEDAVKQAKAAEEAAREAERERLRAQRRAENPDGMIGSASKKKLQQREKNEQAAKEAAYQEAQRTEAEREAEQEARQQKLDGDRPYRRGRNYDPDRYKNNKE